MWFASSAIFLQLQDEEAYAETREEWKGDRHEAKALGTEVEHRLEVMDSAVDLELSYIRTQSTTSIV